VLGIVFFSVVYLFFKKSILNKKSDEKIILSMLWLLGTFMGFYWYSRGYIPQIFKGFIFVIFPMIFLVKGSRR
jgi:hypothetical protein